MIEVPLTKGKVALIDDIDADLIQLSWYYCSKGYARRREKGTRRPVHLHRVILERKVQRALLRCEETDHANCNPLDNRRCNLRVASHAQNNRNRKRQRNNRSGFIGVSRKKKCLSRPWQAHITVEGKRVHLGYFAMPEQAAEAYNQAAKLHHGDFATLN